MKKILLLIFLLTAAVMPAQEKIDRLMDTFATTGSAQYKSLVIRNSETQTISKIIKTLEINNTLKANSFYQTFKEESKNAFYSENKRTVDTKNFMLIFQQETEDRIYLLKIEKSQIKVQLIITKNDSKKK